jgi:hypothetical protein
MPQLGVAVYFWWNVMNEPQPDYWDGLSPYCWPYIHRKYPTIVAPQRYSNLLIWFNMGVSYNGGTTKWMVSNGKSLENGWFRGTTILGNLHVYYSILYHDCHKGRKWVKLDSSTCSTLFIQPLSLPQRPWLAQSSSRCRPRCLVQYFTFLSDLGGAIHISK